MDLKNHWSHIYRTKSSDKVSWYQPHLQVSLEFIQGACVSKDDRIIDVGGGASTLVDDLIQSGFQNITILDIAGEALMLSQNRIGAKAQAVNWIEKDVLNASLPAQYYDLWHDRAVFHFLTQPEDRRKYVETVLRAMRKGGHVIIAAFSLDGPRRCSGLDVVRYSAESMLQELGDRFELVGRKSEEHRTPTSVRQNFLYCHFKIR
jgi:ubiquinone/menaquinone biosynthesis C-methylase UbiE